jgi:hypothetical protein
MRRQPVLFTAALMVLAWTAVPLLAQSSATATTSPEQPPVQPPATTAPTQAPDQQPPGTADPGQTPEQQPPGTAAPAQTPDQTKPTDPAAAKPPDQGRPASQTPGVRTGSVKASDSVTVGGYGSMRYEANTLDKPKPSGFDFRRFVLTADATPHDRLQAYVEIEFERLAEIEVERAVDRSDEGVVFGEELEGGNGGEISMEQMWGQFKFGDPFSVRLGQILVPLGRFNINHDDDKWDIPRRSLVDRNVPVLPVRAAWTELGIGATGSKSVGKSGQLTYQGYVVNGAILDFTIEKVVEAEGGQSIVKLASEAGLTRGPVNGEEGVRAGTWRVGYSPTLTTDFGFSGYIGRYTPDFLEVDERLTSLGIDGLWKRGAFALEGEYIHTHLGDTDRVVNAFIDTVTGSTGIPPLAGAQGTEAEFAITDLTPSRRGFWLEGRYRFWRERWKDTFLGKGFDDPHLSAVVRYERVKLHNAIQEVAIENGEIERGDAETLRQERTTFALAYRPIQTVVFSVATEFNRRLEGPVLVFPRGFPERRYATILAGLAFGF